MLLAIALMLICFAVPTQESLSGSDSATTKEGKSQADDTNLASESTEQNVIPRTVYLAGHDVENTELETANPQRDVQVSTVAKDSPSNRKRETSFDQADDSPAEKHRRSDSATADIRATDGSLASGSSLATDDSAETEGSLAAAGSSSTAAGSSATGSLSTTGAASAAASSIPTHPISKPISCHPNNAISMSKAVEESGGVTIGGYWDAVRVNVDINDYTIYPGTISGNKADYGDVKVDAKVDSNPNLDNTIVSKYASLWKFFLQALTFRPREIIWFDYENRVFQIVDGVALYCDYYSTYMGHGVVSIETAKEKMQSIRAVIRKNSLSRVDNIPIFTPWKGHVADRIRFQFGRIGALELYRKYLEDAKEAGEVGDSSARSGGSSVTSVSDMLAGGSLSSPVNPSATADASASSDSSAIDGSSAVDGTLPAGDLSALGHSATASGSSVDASSSATGSGCGLYAVSSDMQIFTPRYEKPITDLLNGRRPQVGATWYQVFTNIFIDKFAISSDTISGNKRDHPDAVRTIEPPSETICFTEILNSPDRCFWKFLLQVLAFPPSERAVALQWEDEINGMFKIADFDALCALYRECMPHNTDDDNAVILSLVYGDIEHGQRILNEGRPIFTPLAKTTANRTLFQFGRHAGLKLYWKYLVEVNRDADRHNPLIAALSK